MTTPPGPSIGFIGAGRFATALARQLARRHRVVLSNSRGPHTLGWVTELGPSVSAATRVDAARADIVVLAVPWGRLSDALADLPPWRGRLVVDTINPLDATGALVDQLDGRTSSEVVAAMLPGARLVKALNHLPSSALDPQAGPGRRVIFLSGDHDDANQELAALLEDLGYAPLVLGPLAAGGPLQQYPDGPLAARDLVEVASRAS